MTESYSSPQNPEIHLHNQEVRLDMHQEIYPATEVGLPIEDENNHFSVTSEIILPGHDQESTSIALIRVTNRHNGVAQLYATGLVEDEEGGRRISGSMAPISPSTELVLGRKTRESAEARIDSSLLFGQGTEAFSKTVSRDHLKLTLDVNGSLLIEDISTNGTKVIGAEVDETAQPMITVNHVPGSRVTHKANRTQKLIEAVPTDQERIKAEQAQEKAAEDELFAKVEEIRAQMGELTEGLNDNDKLALWKYASGTINKRKAQLEENGQESKNQDMIAGEGWRQMSAKAREVASSYKHLMEQKSRLLG